MSYSFPNFEPVHCFMSSSNCCFLTRIQVSWETSKVIWYSYLFKNFPQFVVICTVKGFSVINGAEVDMFMAFPCFLSDPTNVSNLSSASSSFPKSSLYIWNFSVHILLKTRLKDFPVCCDPHSQWSRSRCFSVILLLFLWSNRCWQSDLWFLCLF